MKKAIILSILINYILYAYPQTGTITNISVQPNTDGSGLLDIFFNLSGEADSYNIKNIIY